MDNDQAFDIERHALGQALTQFIADTRPEVAPQEVESLIAEVLTLYDELVGTGMLPAEASQLLIRQAARAAAAGTGRTEQNLN